LYGAGSATARAEATSTDERAKELKSILIMEIYLRNECITQFRESYETNQED
jgi:hypothetical protein